MKSRKDLHALLAKTIGNSNVYFQPPESVSLKFPCIVYNLDGDLVDNADDTLYNRRKKYEVTYITKDPDSTVPDLIEILTYCSLDQVFNTEGLYHYVFTIYF